MFKRMNVILAIALIAATFSSVEVAQKQSVPKQQDKLALGQSEVTQLLLLMDTDKNGKISKQEWMNFMEAEFDRLDRDKSGELDVKEIAQSKVRASQSLSVVGK